MSKIFYFMGKSASGKDTIFQEMKKKLPTIKTIVQYTTRPIRENEQNGREYFFVDETVRARLEEEGKIIELREYDTIHGIWKYFTVDDGQIDLDRENYFVIGTLEAYSKMRQHFGEEKVVPIYIEVESGERILRAVKREKKQKIPKYTELCRRYVADEQDFSEDKLRKENIKIRFYNQEVKECTEEISLYIRKYM